LSHHIKQLSIILNIETKQKDNNKYS